MTVNSPNMQSTATLDLPIHIREMTIAYHRKPVLWEVNLDIPQGKLVGLVGPNGAGKSTLLKAIMGMMPLLSGSVRIFGETYANVRQRVAYVPQRESVDWDFPASVLDVVLMGFYGRINWWSRITRQHQQLAMEALDRVGMAELAQRQISQLSGGQQQRTFLARALIQPADLFLLDEPFAAVDASTEQALVSILRALQSEGKTILVVHHDLHTVPEYFDYLVLLNMRIVAAGPMETTFHQDNLQKTYGGKLTLLEQVSEAMRHREAP
jgi:manganese/zinc/iron transport system ATP- binding protein